MAVTMTGKLDIGAAFPRLSLMLAGGGEIVVPDDLNSSYTILLFYRGHW